MSPKCSVVVALSFLVCNPLIAQVWQDRTQVDHGSDHLQAAPPEPGACDPRRGGAWMFRTTGMTYWDGAVSSRLALWGTLWNGQTPNWVYAAAACDQDTGLAMIELSDGASYSWTASFAASPTNQQVYANWDPLLGRNVPVGLDRMRHGLAWDPVSHTMLAFGGMALGAGQPGSTFLWQTTPRYAWAPVTGQPQPPSRLDPLLATDTARGRIVLFGGRDASGPAMGDTWEWNGQAWAARTTTPAPSARWAAGFTQDARRLVCVLHGGTDGVATFADTWEWNGTAWTQRASSALPRQGHQLFYDPQLEQVIAWGGDSWRNQQGMTAWDGVQWWALPNFSPLPRTSMSVATDAYRGRLVLFGGVVDGVVRDDTWEWDGTQWLQLLPAHRPPARSGAAMAYDPLRQRTVLYGGRQSTVSWNWHYDTWEWDGYDWTPLAPAAAIPFLTGDVHLAFSPALGGLALTNAWGFLPEPTWLLDNQGWRPLPVTTPQVEEGFAMALHPATGEVVLYGRDASNWVPWSSTWVLQNGAWLQRQVASLPGVLRRPVLIEDPATGDLLIASGDDNRMTWRWNGTTWTGLWGMAPFLGGVGAIDPLRQIPVAFDDGMHWFTQTPLSVSGVLGVTGCPGTPGELLLRQTEGLWLGNASAALAATHAMAGAPVAFAAALAGSGPYPAFQGCNLVPVQSVLGVTLANGSGAAAVPVPMPLLPALRGVALDLQGIAIDLGSPNGLIAATQIRRVVLGD